jgi:hypothetical protein
MELLDLGNKLVRLAPITVHVVVKSSGANAGVHC